MERFLKSRYKIGEKISENPFSVGYKGFFLGTKKPLIIKIYKRGTLNSSIINKMKEKVKDFSQIKHHGIAKIYDGDYGWQGFYYVREYINGQSLEELINAGEQIEVDKAVSIVEEICNALKVVHEKGIIHGGLKPSNIFIDSQGVVKITDFVIEGEIKQAMPQKAELIMGDGMYTSPEELLGKPATFTSDIYALGLIMAKMTHAESIEYDKGLLGSLAKLRTEALLNKQILSSLPKYLQEIIFKALQLDPSLRFSTINELKRSLENRRLVLKPPLNEEFVTLFKNTVSRYEKEDKDKEEDQKREKEKDKEGEKWGDEKGRNWIIVLILILSFISGLIYVFLFGG
jgi:eukaryotic-like serine/threonine-protein kinase